MSLATTHERVRAAVLGLTGLETAFWLYLSVGGLLDVLPFAQGYGEFAAVLGTLVFFLFVLPALVLAVRDRALDAAILLAGVAGLLYVYDPVLRLAAVLDGMPFLGLLATGLVAALTLAATRVRRAADLPSRG